MADNQPLVLEARKINKVYSNQVQVLKGVDLKIAAGEKVAIVGSSGAGKSTLLHILGTLDRPSSGELFYFGAPPPFDSDDKLCEMRNRMIGFVFQFHHLLPEFTALENVMMPCLAAHTDREEAYRLAKEMLAKVGLSHRLDHRPGELSGGEQQRVAVARALVRRPKLVIADEPTGNLDRVNGDNVYGLLCDLNLEMGTAFLVATHNLEMAARMDRMCYLKDGVVEEGRG